MTDFLILLYIESKIIRLINYTISTAVYGNFVQTDMNLKCPDSNVFMMCPFSTVLITVFTARMVVGHWRAAKKVSALSPFDFLPSITRREG